jgi:flagellar biosynthesis component FlhA
VLFRSTLSNMYRDQDGFLHVFTLSPMIEKVLRGSLSSSDGGLGFQIETEFAQILLNAIGEHMEKMAQLGFLPILLCPREIRLALRRLTEQAFSNLIVMAFSEISHGTKVKAESMVDVEIPGYSTGRG